MVVLHVTVLHDDSTLARICKKEEKKRKTTGHDERILTYFNIWPSVVDDEPFQAMFGGVRVNRDTRNMWKIKLSDGEKRKHNTWELRKNWFVI